MLASCSGRTCAPRASNTSRRAACVPQHAPAARTASRIVRRADGSSGSSSADTPLQDMNNPSGININGARPTSPKGWNLMVQALKDADCKLLSSQEVVSVQAQGGMVVDIRPAGDYEKSHIPGAVSVPFYRPIAGWSPMQAMRRVAFAAFGILNGTEVNPDFEKEVDAAAADAKSVILYCNQGGNFNVMEMGKASFMPDKPDGESRGGKTVLQTRSVIAAYRLLVCGRTSGLSVYKGGFREWVSSGERPVEQ